MLTLPPIDDTSGDATTLQFLGWLVKMMNPRIVIEAGSYRGHFALIAGSVLIAYDGHVYTADTIDHGWTPFIEQNELTGTVTFVNDDFAKVADLVADGTADLAFVDSGAPFSVAHGGWEHAVRWRHYELAKRLVRKGGLIITDDVSMIDWDGCEQIRAEASLILRGGRGLAIRVQP